MGMLESVLLLVLAGFVSYFIGTINFSKIIAWHCRKKDITKMGSQNPGAMNLLRQFGLGLALLAFVAEVLKSGLVCLAFSLLYQHFGVWGGGDFVFYLAGFCLMVGYDFPVWSKFKGGKGIACFAGILIFSPIWYVSLGWFAVCFVLFIIIDIGSVVSLTYIGGLTIATTIYMWLMGYSVWVASYVTAIIWALYILTLFKHRGNLKRLFAGNETKVGFKGKLKKFFSKSEKTDESAKEETNSEENLPEIQVQESEDNLQNNKKDV